MINMTIFEFFENVFSVFHKCCSVPEEFVAAARQRTVDGSGHREDLTSLLARVAGGGEGSAARGGFYHQNADRQPADKAISLHEMVR